MAREHVVLLAFADARGDLPELREEVRRLQEMFEEFQRRGRCTLVFRPNATLAQIYEVLQQQRDRVAIFHYGGHADSGRLLLEAGLEGGPAHAAGLAELLGQQRGLNLAFLNGCSTRPQVQRLLDAGVPAVVATSRPIDDRVAREFAVAFYQALTVGGDGSTGGLSVAAAFAAAQSFIKASRGSATRDLVASPPAHDDVTDPLGMPWGLHVRNGADQADRWNLFGDDPLFGLPPLPPRDLPENPYLEPLCRFTADRAELFFGRSAEIRELYDRVADPDGPPIVLVYGQSGVGKSSLLDAGLVPRLTAGGRVVRYQRRDSQLGLLGSLRAALTEEGPARTIGTAWSEQEARLGRPLVVILDQVEEALTGSGAAHFSELEELVDALREGMGDRACRPLGRLVLGFRKEWLAELDRRLSAAGLPRTCVFLEPMDRRGIVDVIDGAARPERLQRRYGLELEQGLAGAIADDLLADPASPVAPTLQVLLSKMWERASSQARSRPKLDRALYEALRREGALLGDFLDRQLATLRTYVEEAAVSGLALDVLEFHTTPLGSAAERTATQMFEAYGHIPEVCGDLVRHCLDLYLLADTASPTEAQAHATRLIHDTLAPLVRERYETSDRPAQRARRILRGRSTEWVEGREGTPLDQADLAVIEANASAMRSWSDPERRLVQASRAERERRERQRQRLQGEALLRSFGHLAGPIGRVELAALWELAGLPEASGPTRVFLVEAALEGRGRAEQLTNRLEPVVHAAVGLCPLRTQAVIREVVLPVVRGTGTDPFVRWTATRVGLLLRARGDEFVALAGEALVGFLEHCEGQIDPEAVPLARLLPSSVAERAAGTAADRLSRFFSNRAGDSATSARILAAIVAYLPSDKLKRFAPDVLRQLFLDIAAAKDPAERDRLAENLSVVAGKLDEPAMRPYILPWLDGPYDATPGSADLRCFILEVMLGGLSDQDAEWYALRSLRGILGTNDGSALDSLVGLAARMARRLGGPAAKQAAETVFETFDSRSDDASFVEHLGAILSPIADRLDAPSAEQLVGLAIDRISRRFDRQAGSSESSARNEPGDAESEARRREVVGLLLTGQFGNLSESSAINMPPGDPVAPLTRANTEEPESSRLLVKFVRLERVLAAARLPSSGVRSAIEHHTDLVLEALAGTGDPFTQMSLANALRDAGKLPASAARRAADVLLAAMSRVQEPLILAEMASALAATSGRPQRQVAGRAAEILLSALGIARDAADIRRLANALESLSAQLPQETVDRLVVAMRDAVERADDLLERINLVSSIRAISDRLLVAATPVPAPHLTLVPVDGTPTEPSASVSSEGAAPAGSGADQVVKPSIERVIDALESCSNIDEMSQLAADFSQIRLPDNFVPRLAERCAKRIVREIKQGSRDYQLIEALRLVAGPLTGDTAERVALVLSDALGNANWTRFTASALRGVAEVLATVLTKLPADVARDIACRDAEAINSYAKNADSPVVLAESVKALGQMSTWVANLDIDRAAEWAVTKLLEALAGAQDEDERGRLGGAMCDISTHLPAEAAARLFDVLLDVLERRVDADDAPRWLLDAFQKSVVRLNALSAEHVLDRLANALIDVASTARDSRLAYALSRTLAALGELTPDRVGAAFVDAIDAASDPHMVATLATVLVNRTGGPVKWFPRSASGIVAGRVLKVMDETTDPPTFARLAWASAVAGWLSESAAWQIANRIIDNLESAGPTSSIANLAAALDRVISDRPLPDADSLVSRATDVLGRRTLTSKHPDDWPDLISAVDVLRARLDEKSSRRVADGLIEALVACHPPFRPRDILILVRALADLPVASWADSVTTVAELLLGVVSSAECSRELAEFETGFHELASRLPQSLTDLVMERVAERAAEQLVGRLIDAVATISQEVRPQLVDGLGIAPRWLTSQAAHQASVRLLDALERVYESDWLVCVLKATRPWLSETAAVRGAAMLITKLEGATGANDPRRFADAVVGVSIGLPGPTLGYLVERLHDNLAKSYGLEVDTSTVSAIVEILSDRSVAEVVEVLKYPMCVGPVRADLLAMLGRKIGVSIDEHMEQFAELVESLGISPGQLAAPPARFSL